MGLPLFITPVEPEVPAKAKEPVASPARTSIRRTRTARGPHARLLADHRRRRALQMFDHNELPSQDDWGTSRLSTRSPPEMSEPLRGYADYHLDRPSRTPPLAEDGILSTLVHARRLQQEERARRNARLSFERQNLPGEPDGPLMPPVPESRDFASSIDERQREREIDQLDTITRTLRTARRHAVPTPPYTDNDRISIDAESRGEPRAREGIPLLPTRPLARHRDYDMDEFESHRDSQWTGDRQNNTASRVRYRVAAAMNERARRQAAQARLDGLGDRERSVSPVYPEQDVTWDTLLANITPDLQLPSAGSSFASSAAAAASSSNSLPQSMTSSMTSVARTEEDPANNDCDGPESDSDMDDWDADAGDIDDMMDSARRFRGDGFFRSYADITARRSRMARRTEGRDTDQLGGMHRIISRLAERDEIPDEWWAEAGLRNVRREPSS
ncbi:hypothetical protein BP6252_12273 [Coleophoma cylindrospora]|uniref:Uncharacterized protein n=1 Tax=Coleophoma cylindrospora TaxID=1849047 RepID=A0A3D8QGT7_9HELO|nr:hypothetical protein BP6252_12273 [Coleophoma cylindrospora]